MTARQHVPTREHLDDLKRIFRQGMSEEIQRWWDAPEPRHVGFNPGGTIYCSDGRTFRTISEASQACSVTMYVVQGSLRREGRETLIGRNISNPLGLRFSRDPNDVGLAGK